MVMDCVSSEQTDEELNRFNYGFVQNWRKETHLSKPKMEKKNGKKKYKKKIFFHLAPLFIVRFVCLVVRP